MSGLVVSHDPIGTREEVMRAGLHPNDAASCSRPDGPGKNRGCPFYEECLFQRDGYGVTDNCTAFRDKGPENVPYFISIETTVGRKEKEDFMPCFAFMHVLKNRQDAADRTGEVIEIIGREGDTITKVETLEVKPGPEVKDIRLKTVTIPDFVVPKFKRLGQGIDGKVADVRAAIMKGRQERMRRQREARAGLATGDPEPQAEPVVRKRRVVGEE